MQSRRQTINEEVTGLVGPVLEASGFELVDVEYTSDRGRRVLRLYVDRPGGVTLEDCARASREVGDLIDVKNIIEHGYVLEVSSPGLNRPLKKEKDFLRALGKKIKVLMEAPVEGRRKFTGTLKSFEGGILGLEMESGLVDLQWSDVEKANLVYDFN